MHKVPGSILTENKVLTERQVHEVKYLDGIATENGILDRQRKKQLQEFKVSAVLSQRTEYFTEKPLN